MVPFDVPIKTYLPVGSKRTAVNAAGLSLFVVSVGRSLGRREHAPLVLAFMLIVQFEPPRVSLPKIDYECFPSAQQYQKDLADSDLAPWTRNSPTIDRPVLRMK